jgi:hypothetical protein
MGGRRYIPLLQLGILIVASGLLAIVAIRMAPPSTDITVQNATAATFGSPLGSHSLTLDLTNSVSAGGNSGVISQVQRVTYVAPSLLTVEEISPIRKSQGTVPASSIAALLSRYDTVVLGSGTWQRHGSTLTRTESLTTFAKRLHPNQSSIQGRVHESVDVRDGYLVYIELKVLLPRQKLTSGQTAAGGIIGQTFRILRIGGHAAPALAS